MIGGGLNSAVGAAHVAALRMTGKFDLVAGCFSTDGLVNSDTANKYRTYAPENIKELMALRPDRVVILSPTTLHRQHIENVAGYSLQHTPVLCEKALGASSEETRWMLDYPAPLACVFNYFFYDAVQKLRTLINDGEFGTITHIRAEMPQAGYLVSKPQEWRLTDDGIYLDLMTHLLHLVWGLTREEPSQVWVQERKYSDQGVVDYVSAFVTYSTFTADLFVSKCSAGNTNGLRIRVYGTEGSAEWYQLRPDTLVFGRSDIPGVIIKMEVPNKLFKLGHPSAGFVGSIASVYDAWSDNPSHQDLSPIVAHAGLIAIEAMRESAISGRSIYL